MIKIDSFYTLSNKLKNRIPKNENEEFQKAIVEAIDEIFRKFNNIESKIIDVKNTITKLDCY